MNISNVTLRNGYKPLRSTKRATLAVSVIIYRTLISNIAKSLLNLPAPSVRFSSACWFRQLYYCSLCIMFAFSISCVYIIPNEIDIFFSISATWPLHTSIWDTILLSEDVNHWSTKNQNKQIQAMKLTLERLQAE